MENTMMDYIERQPEILKKLLENTNDLVEPMFKAFKDNDIKQVYFCGSGTSNHVGMFTANYFQKYLKVNAIAVKPHNFVYNEVINAGNTIKFSQILVVGVSQSGTSTSTINAIKKAIDLGCKTLSFSQDNESELSKLCDYRIKMACEKEMVPPETQGYTTAILTGYLWSVIIANKLGYLNDELLSDKMNNIDHLIKVMPDIINDSKRWVEANCAEILVGDKFYFMGDSLNYVTAFEGSLKFGETNRVAFRPMETEESAHLIDLAFDSEVYTMFIVSNNEYCKRGIEIAEFTKQVTDHVFVISDCYKKTNKDLLLSFNVDEELTPLMFVIPFQIMGALIALKKGYDTSCYPYNLNSIAHNEDYIFLK